MMDMVDSEDFLDIWKVMVDRIDRFIKSHTTSKCLIVFFCESGRDRSVALTSAFADVLQNEALMVDEVHMSRPSLFEGCKGECDECQLVHDRDRREYQRAVDRIGEMWYRTSFYLAPTCSRFRKVHMNLPPEKDATNRRRARLGLHPQCTAPGSDSLTQPPMSLNPWP